MGRCYALSGWVGETKSQLISPLQHFVIASKKRKEKVCEKQIHAESKVKEESDLSAQLWSVKASRNSEMTADC